MVRRSRKSCTLRIFLTRIAESFGTMSDSADRLAVIGWREWLVLPDLGIGSIKAKVDTGARTSALHAFYVDPFKHHGETWVRFGIHPRQHDTHFELECEARVRDSRVVSDSGGHKERRYVIETSVALGGVRWKTEITLTDRDSMKFRMLLGRTALVGRFLVNPKESYLLGKKRV